MLSQTYLNRVLSDARVSYLAPAIADAINSDGLTAENVMRLARHCQHQYYNCDWLVNPYRLYAYAFGLEAVAYRLEDMEKEAAAFSCRYPDYCPFVCCSER